MEKRSAPPRAAWCNRRGKRTGARGSSTAPASGESVAGWFCSTASTRHLDRNRRDCSCRSSRVKRPDSVSGSFPGLPGGYDSRSARVRCPAETRNGMNCGEEKPAASPPTRATRVPPGSSSVPLFPSLNTSISRSASSLGRGAGSSAEPTACRNSSLRNGFSRYALTPSFSAARAYPSPRYTPVMMITGSACRDGVLRSLCSTSTPLIPGSFRSRIRRSIPPRCRIASPFAPSVTLSAWCPLDSRKLFSIAASRSLSSSSRMRLVIWFSPKWPCLET